MTSTIVLIITVLISSFLGLLVYIKNPYKSQNREFGLLAASIVGWVGTLFFYYAVSDPSMVLFLGRLNFAIALFISLFFYRFIYFFPREDLKLPLLIDRFIFIFTILISILTFFTPYVDKQEIINGVERINVFGDLAIIYVANFLLNTSLGIILLITKLKRSTKIIKLQLQYLLTGFILLFLIAVTTNLILPFFFKNYILVPFGPTVSIFFLGFAAYALIVRRLLQIRMLIVRPLIYVIFIGIITSVYSVFIIWLARSFFNKDISPSEIILFEILAIFITLLFTPLKTILDMVTNRIFFKTKYSSNYLILILTKIMATTLDLHSLTIHTLDQLLTTMNINGGAFIIKDDHITYPPIEVGMKQDEKYYQRVLEYASDKKEIVITEEVENESDRSLLNSLKIEILLPLFAGNKLNGYLILKEKKSGEIYLNQDIALLLIFGPEIAVAIQNTKSYEQIKNFNITLEKEVTKATDELKKANEHLKELDKLKDDFFSVASHELRTPLAAIRWNSAMINSYYSSKINAGHFAGMVNDIHEASLRLIEIVNDFLDTSRLEQGRITFQKEKINLPEIIKDVIRDLDSLARTGGLHIKYVSGKQNIPEIISDSGRIKQVLFNLIGNSIKFTKAGGVEVALKKDKNSIKVFIKDTGIGILPEKHHLLFQKFKQAGKAYLNRDSSSGTGLGLYISRLIVEGLGGKIKLEKSELEKGSTFSFTLPFKSAN
jgi:signal transduction histidine kinase